MIEVVGSQDVVIKNLSITDGDHGIAVFGGSQRTRIENVEVYGNTRGLWSDSTVTGLQVAGSRFHDQHIG